MFAKILGKKKDNVDKENASHAMLIEKISKMNLTEMRSYIKINIKDYAVSEDGLNEVMHKLITEDEKTKKYYLKEDDMDSKKKKTFDLVLNISENKKVNLITVEQMNQFIEIYKDIIDKYDQEYKEIYFSRFTDAIGLAIAHVALKIELNEKMTILGE